jgi:hypothetical protein
MTLYGSTETHDWAKKAASFLGLGRRAYRQVPCKADYSMDVDALRSAIASVSASELRRAAKPRPPKKGQLLTNCVQRCE